MAAPRHGARPARRAPRPWPRERFRLARPARTPRRARRLPRTVGDAGGRGRPLRCGRHRRKGGEGEGGKGEDKRSAGHAGALPGSLDSSRLERRPPSTKQCQKQRATPSDTRPAVEASRSQPRPPDRRRGRRPRSRSHIPPPVSSDEAGKRNADMAGGQRDEGPRERQQPRREHGSLAVVPRAAARNARRSAPPFLAAAWRGRAGARASRPASEPTTLPAVAMATAAVKLIQP